MTATTGPAGGAPHPDFVLHVRTADSPARMSFLLHDVTALTPVTAAAASFSDLGQSWLELVIHGAEPTRLATWLATALHQKRAQSVTKAEESIVIRGSHISGAAARQRYGHDLAQLSDRALRILAGYPAAPVPGDLVAAEVLDVHRHRGDARRSLSWHIAWLARDTATFPGVPAPDIAVTARLAHSQWLRLTGGIPDHRAEVDMLRTCR